MVINEIKFLLSRHLLNSTGWKSSEKIMVIESDDWGSIRMPSKSIYEKLLKSGYPVDKDPYEQYDSLENNYDITLLFDLLSSFKDCLGNHPVLTANCVIGNPDFEKITKDNFQRYHFEFCTETFSKYPHHDRVWDYWKKGLESGLFFPQYHAREHINVSIILEALQKGNPSLLYGFQMGYLGGLRKDGIKPQNIYVKSSYFRNLQEKKQVQQIFLEGLKVFKKLFGYASESFIPTNYLWSPDFDEAMYREGVLFNQGRHSMAEPLSENRNRYYKRFLGEKNHLGQINLVRNARFEPSLVINKEKEFDKCLKEIEIAFKWKKPAIVSMHRINFTGNINEKNRDINLKLLTRLFSTIIKKWPDIQFIHSVSLGERIRSNT